MVVSFPRFIEVTRVVTRVLRYGSWPLRKPDLTIFCSSFLRLALSLLRLLVNQGTLRLTTITFLFIGAYLSRILDKFLHSTLPIRQLKSRYRCTALTRKCHSCKIICRSLRNWTSFLGNILILRNSNDPLIQIVTKP